MTVTSCGGPGAACKRRMTFLAWLRRRLARIAFAVFFLALGAPTLYAASIKPFRSFAPVSLAVCDAKATELGIMQRPVSVVSHEVPACPRMTWINYCTYPKKVQTKGNGK